MPRGAEGVATRSRGLTAKKWVSRDFVSGSRAGDFLDQFVVGVTRKRSQMETPREPHFFKPLLPGFQSGVAIPLDFYSKHIQGAEINKPWKLRSDASDQIWEVIREGRTLTKGWKEFTEAHDLRIGDIVIFKHEGDMVFHVTPFGPSCCEILWSDADDAPTFSYDYCFLAEVTPTNQKDDKMFLPVEAMRCGALNQQCKEVKLVNKEGKSWTARFGFSESDGAYYISRGWRKFCRDNRCTNGDLFVFNVVGDGTTTPLLCVCPERKECTELLIKHFSRIDEKKKLREEDHLNLSPPTISYHQIKEIFTSGETRGG
ncbi:hypothetical protein YC2023_094956 [Brassica napus]